MRKELEEQAPQSVRGGKFTPIPRMCLALTESGPPLRQVDDEFQSDDDITAAWLLAALLSSPPCRP